MQKIEYCSLGFKIGEKVLFSLNNVKIFGVIFLAFQVFFFAFLSTRSRCKPNHLFLLVYVICWNFHFISTWWMRPNIVWNWKWLDTRFFSFDKHENKHHSYQFVNDFGPMLEKSNLTFTSTARAGEYIILFFSSMLDPSIGELKIIQSYKEVSLKREKTR